MCQTQASTNTSLAQTNARISTLSWSSWWATWYIQQTKASKFKFVTFSKASLILIKTSTTPWLPKIPFTTISSLDSWVSSRKSTKMRALGTSRRVKILKIKAMSTRCTWSFKSSIRLWRSIGSHSDNGCARTLRFLRLLSLASSSQSLLTSRSSNSTSL